MTTTKRQSRIRNGVTAVVLMICAGCGIRPDAQPTELERISLNAESAGVDAAGVDRVYFVGPGESGLLRSVARDAASPKNLIEILFSGPIDAELQQNYYTSIPADTELISARPIGTVLRIDVTEAMINVTGPTLTRALAQIVYTATDLDTVEAVQIRVNGEQVAWPTANGESTTGELRIDDFPDAVENSQPDYPALPVAG